LNLPNRISLLRILLIPLLVLVLLKTDLAQTKLISVSIFVIVALTDALDGYLARRFKQVTILGKFLDPLADKILVICALLCLVELDIINTIPVMILIVRDFSVSGLRMAASSHGRIIAADTLGKYKAAVLDAAVAMLIVGIPYGDIVLWLGVTLAVVSGTVMIYKNKEALNG
jgi:CDP-diacylglycerol---glycerol-3-phosphate 3-phosphatidyltransferase